MTAHARFPFSAVVGQGEARLALLLAAVDPGIGGVLLRGDKGAAKSTLARGLAGMLPGGAPFVELPLGATEQTVVGTIARDAITGSGSDSADSAAAFRPGLLAAANGGVLYVDEVNLLPDPVVDVLLDVAASGVNRVERDGVSHSHSARFVLVGSMNPEEGELRPQLLDRFGLSVEVKAPTDPQLRAEIVRRRLTHDAGGRVGGGEGDIVLRARLAALDAAGGPAAQIRAVERELAAYPASAEAARADWLQAREALAARARAPVPQATPYATPYAETAGAGEGAARDEANDDTRGSFLALTLCLMLGTAGLPHVLMRSYTTPSVSAARRSVGWSLLFILLLYFMAPPLAVLVKYVIYTDFVGASYSALPDWVHGWSALGPGLLSIVDVNGDGAVQLAEISMGADVLVLAMPEIAGLPYVVTGLVAAGALAAALSTADGLLLTLSNALSHDAWYRVVSPRMTPARRVMASKILLLAVAFAAAWVAARRPADILLMVSAAFSFAASSFFPALVTGIFWKRANGWGATAGMATGVAVTFAYMAHTHPWLREWLFGVPRTVPVDLWFGVQPVAAGVFGAAAAFLTIVIVSLLTAPPDAATRALVDFVRDTEEAGEPAATPGQASA